MTSLAHLFVIDVHSISRSSLLVRSLYCIVLYCIVLYCIVLYCIVLYLYIYIVLFAVRTNKKRFQCERPREKRAVLREQREAPGSPIINKVDRVEGGSWFQSAGQTIAKARA